MNIILHISQDRAIYFLQNGVLLVIMRHLVVEIDNLSQCCSKSPCSILNTLSVVWATQVLPDHCANRTAWITYGVPPGNNLKQSTQVFVSASNKGYGTRYVDAQYVISKTLCFGISSPLLF